MTDLYVWSKDSITAWDTEDETTRQTRLADNADAYADEPCSCGHCAECNEPDFTEPEDAGVTDDDTWRLG